MCSIKANDGGEFGIQGVGRDVPHLKKLPSFLPCLRVRTSAQLPDSALSVARNGRQTSASGGVLCLLFHEQGCTEDVQQKFGVKNAALLCRALLSTFKMLQLQLHFARDDPLSERVTQLDSPSTYPPV